MIDKNINETYNENMKSIDDNNKGAIPKDEHLKTKIKSTDTIKYLLVIIELIITVISIIFIITGTVIIGFAFLILILVIMSIEDKWLYK